MVSARAVTWVTDSLASAILSGHFYSGVIWQKGAKSGQITIQVNSSTVGRDENVIREYIRHQEAEDRRVDQLNLMWLALPLWGFKKR